MSRLTELIDIDGMEIKTSKERPLSNQGLGAILHKLYALEDLEEKLGCPLEVVFKAFEEGINVYYEDEERHQFHNNLRLEYEKNLGWGLVYIYGSRCRNDMTMKLDMEFFLLKDYGKTWWLKSEREEKGE